MNSLLWSIFMIVFGFFSLKYPPEFRNSMFGYTFHMANINKDTWDVAQKHSGFSLIIGGIVNGFLGIWSIIKPMAINTKNMQILFVVISVIGIIIIEELHLKKLFNKDGSRR